jgi:hypothetical protein
VDGTTTRSEAGYDVGHVPTAAVAVDMSESLDTRASAAGRRVLQNLLEEFRAGDGHLNTILITGRGSPRATARGKATRRWE